MAHNTLLTIAHLLFGLMGYLSIILYRATRLYYYLFIFLCFMCNILRFAFQNGYTISVFTP